MYVKFDDIKCVHFEESDQSCYKGDYKPDEQDYFHRMGGYPEPCFCTMIDEETIDNHDTGKTPNVWISLECVAKCCRNYQTEPRNIDVVGKY